VNNLRFYFELTCKRINEITIKNLTGAILYNIICLNIFAGFDSYVGQVTKRFGGQQGHLDPFSDRIEVSYCPCSNGKGKNDRTNGYGVIKLIVIFLKTVSIPL
jgi:hypothetical protein